MTILTNYIPLEAAAAGPNFYEFGDDVLYYIYISNRGTGKPDITYEFRFKTKIAVTKVAGGHSRVLAHGLASPPCNIGPASTPNYSRLAQAAIHRLPTGETVFAGQRNDGFFADLGAIFDLGDLRPFQDLQIAPMAAAGDSTR